MLTSALLGLAGALAELGKNSAPLISLPVNRNADTHVNILAVTDSATATIFRWALAHLNTWVFRSFVLEKYEKYHNLSISNQI